MPDAPARPSDPGTVRLVTSETEFAELRDAWNRVAAACRDPSVFLAHEWFDAAWQWRKANATLFVLCHYRAERLTAILPLVVRTVKIRGIPVRELAFLTVPDTQWCDLVVAECDAADAASALAHALRRRQREWDAMRLKYLRSGTMAGSALAAALAQQRFAVRHHEAPGNPYIALDSTWDAFYATRSRRLKKANNLSANRLKRAGAVRIDWHAPGMAGGATVAGIEDQAIAVSAASWKVETGNSLENAGPQAFIRRLSALATERHWLSIWLLSLDERPVAMEYQLIAGGDVFALRSDFDASLEEISPGSSLNRHLLEQLFGRGLRRYYMGPGNNAYKHRWTELVEPVREMSVYGRSFSGRSLALWESSVKPAVVRMRERFARQRTGKVENDDEE
jgi:CelD/BcsL family acetyltransferase involved in cellulose biosynthesis